MDGKGRRAKGGGRDRGRTEQWVNEWVEKEGREGRSGRWSGEGNVEEGEKEGGKG